MFTVTASNVKIVVPAKAAAKKAESKAFAPKAAMVATAAAILLAGPAHADKQGLTILNGTNAAPGKYEQFFDPRPVVEVQSVGPGAVTKDAARIMPNKQVGPGACKLISGAPCADFATGK